MDFDDLKMQAETSAASSDPIDRLAAAVGLSRRLSEMGDELIDHYVDAARTAGCSWAQIGDALGVSRQAAQQRQKGWLARTAGRLAKGSGLFTRFTSPARDTVTEAQAIARDRRDPAVDAHHVLLGLVRSEDGGAAQVFRLAEVTPEMVVAAVEERVGPGPGEGRGKGHIPFTGDAKKALELSLREALALKDDVIGTEHVLLALTRTGTAGEALGALGLDRDRTLTLVTASRV
jgi:hypothetical protein